jgi:hypothetical protein
MQGRRAGERGERGPSGAGRIFGGRRLKGARRKGRRGSGAPRRGGARLQGGSGAAWRVPAALGAAQNWGWRAGCWGKRFRRAWGWCQPCGVTACLPRPEPLVRNPVERGSEPGHRSVSVDRGDSIVTSDAPPRADAGAPPPPAPRDEPGAPRSLRTRLAVPKESNSASRSIGGTGGPPRRPAAADTVDAAPWPCGAPAVLPPGVGGSE